MAMGAFTGGAIAEITGGNFVEGFATGLTVSALNHSLHTILQDPPEWRLAKKIADVYGGDAKKIYKFLKTHPIVLSRTTDGIEFVHFEGINIGGDAIAIVDNIYANNSNNNNKLFDKGAEFTIKKGFTEVIKKVFKGGSKFWLNDGGLGKTPSSSEIQLKQEYRIRSINSATNKLIEKYFKPFPDGMQFFQIWSK